MPIDQALLWILYGGIACIVICFLTVVVDWWRSRGNGQHRG